EPLPAPGESRSLWWSWRAPANGRVTFGYKGIISYVRPYTGTAVNLLQAVPMSYEPMSANYSFETREGEVYQLQVTLGGTGFSALKLTFMNHDAPATDNFANARL